MTPDERSLLNQFLSDLNATKGAAKDAEAAQAIDQAFKANPDAAYVLTQHALLADQALHQAQQQIEAMQAELDRLQPPAPQPQPASFLGGGAGLGPRVAQPQSSWAQAAQQPPQQQGGGFFGGGPFSGRQSGLGSFLQSAGTTAAGVAGGAFLFEGLSNLFGGHHGFGGGGWGGPGFGGGGFGGGYGGQENVTINNYGDDSGGYDGGYGGDPGSDGDIGGDDYS